MKRVYLAFGLLLFSSNLLPCQEIILPKGKQVLMYDVVGIKFPYDLERRNITASSTTDSTSTTESDKVFAIGAGSVFTFENSNPNSDNIVTIKLISIKPIKNKLIDDAIKNNKAVDGYKIIRCLDKTETEIVEVPISQLKFYEPYGSRLAYGFLVIPFKLTFFPDVDITPGGSLGGYAGIKWNASKDYANIICGSAGMLLTENDIPINAYISFGYIGEITNNFQLAVIVGYDFPNNSSAWVSLGTGYLFSK